MADIHDQAEQWAQANPQDPRAQDIMAKAWASKNPDDPRSAQIMAKFSPSGDDSVMSRLADPDRWKAIAMGTGPYAQQSVHGNPPIAAPAGMFPAIAAGAEAIGASAPGRMAMGTAQGGLEGLLRTPGQDESRLGNAWSGAKTGLLMSNLAEGASRVTSGAKAAGTWAGGKLAGVGPRDAQNYVQDPKLAEELFAQNKSDPMGLSERVKAEVGGGLDDAFDKVSAPALDRVGKAVAGKQIQVAPGDFEGTAAGNEINRSWNTQGNRTQVDVPVYEPHQVQASPVSAEMQIGKPQTQDLPYGKNYSGMGGDTPTADVSTVNRSIEKAGEPQTLENLLLPRGSQQASVPAPTPDRMSLEGPQALSAKRASQKAAFANQTSALNPLAYNAADDAEAIAASRLRKAIENVAPSTVADNDTLSEAARYSAHAKSTLKNNPAAILNDTDGLGSVPTRSMRQFLDEKGGSKLDSLAKALSSGKAVNEVPKEAGLIDRTISRPVGKKVLQGTAKLDGSLGRALQSPALIDALIRAQQGER